MHAGSSMFVLAVYAFFPFSCHKSVLNCRAVISATVYLVFSVSALSLWRSVVLFTWKSFGIMCAIHVLLSSSV